MVKHNYDQAIGIYLPRYKKETSADKRIYILNQLAECYRAAEKTDFSALLKTNIRPGLAKSDSLYALSLELEAIDLLHQKQYDKAATCWKLLADSIPAPDFMRKTTLFNLGYLALVYKGEQATAAPYFSRLKAAYPTDDLTRQTDFLLGRAGALAPAQPPSLSKSNSAKPEEFTLDNCYPNPFNPSTTISYALPTQSSVSLSIYDVLGRQVATLAKGVIDAGYHTATWNATNFASGVYFARLEVADLNGRHVYSKTNKVLLTK
jgi:hypothetical protein